MTTSGGIDLMLSDGFSSHDAQITAAQAAPIDEELTRQRLEERNGRLARWFKVWHGCLQPFILTRWCMQAADVDDLAQEVFLRVLRYSDGTIVENPQSYLFRIAVNITKEWRERARNHLPHDDDGLEDIPVEQHDEPPGTVERSLVNKHVLTAMSQLPRRQQDVLSLHVGDDLTCEQVAKRLNLTTRIVRRDITRAYERLRGQLRFVDGPP